MSQFRYYIRYPLDAENYSDEVEITERIVEGSSSDITQNLSNDEYDVGTVKFNKLKLKLVNSDSFFSEPVDQNSIFVYKRDETILRIEYDINQLSLACGSARCGYSFLSKPKTIFYGLLEDNSSKFEEKTAVQEFTFLGLESIIKKVQVNFSDLSVSDDVETTVFKLLNQSRITRFMTVDASNISLGYNFTPNSIADLENESVLTALDELLFLASSVLYVKDQTIFVQPRTIGSTLKATFYGKAADQGIENIVSIKNYTTGLNRTFNVWKWENSNAIQVFADSQLQYGFRDKEVSSEFVTDFTTQTQILNTLINEYGFPRRELDVEVPMYTPLVEDIFLLDKISLDIPVEVVPPDDGSLPARYGSAIYGEDRYANGITSFTVSSDVEWKVLNRAVSIKNRTLKFKLREEIS